MKIKEIKCPSCNANIKLNNNDNKGVCEYCKTEFLIDDGKVTIEHTGTIEITNDTSLKIAEATLNQFKDYDKSLFLYRRLLYKYAHKKEVYIGLVRSLTKDFSIADINAIQLNEINDYWNKYVSLTNEKESSKYQKNINILNKNYWYSELIEMTNNFNPHEVGDKIKNINESYNNYINHCNEKDKDKSTTEFKYNEYIVEYKKFLNERKRNKKTIFKICGITLLIIILISIIFLLTEKSKIKEKEIKLSLYNEYHLINKDNTYFLKYFTKTYSKRTIKEIVLNEKKKTVDITLTTKNILITKDRQYSFSVIDDTGPIITPLACSFTDTEEIDLNKCFSIYDFTDGTIDNKNAKINTFENDFKTVGKKIINVSIKDQDDNENKLDIEVEIKKTKIELDVSISDKLIVGNTYEIKNSISPDFVSNKKVTYTYDPNFISINKNKLKALRKGTTELCVTSDYDNNVKQCKTLTLNLECKNTYIFNFDGSKEEIITSNEMFCPGTYKIYASVMNKKNFYHLRIKPKGSYTGETLTIYKTSSFLNDEGSKYNLTEGYEVHTEIGITQVKLVKIK